jgi:hypothetical protein
LRCAPLPRCRRRAAAKLPPTSRCCAAANLALSRCRRRRATVCWLVVALLSAVRCRHHMPSCDPLVAGRFRQ